VTGLVAALDHIHPDLALGDKAILESLARGSFGPDHSLDTLAFEVIFEHVPSQLVGELERLDQPLLFQRRKLPLTGQLGTVRKTDKCLVKALQTLVPADIRVNRHIVILAESANEGILKSGLTSCSRRPIY
jgi:hypothetical protein